MHNFSSGFRSAEGQTGSGHIPEPVPGPGPGVQLQASHRQQSGFFRNYHLTPVLFGEFWQYSIFAVCAALIIGGIAK